MYKLIIIYLSYISIIYCNLLDWNKISDHTLIKDLVLLGTHNTGSINSFNVGLSKLLYNYINCQSMTIKSQLENNIQVFDIRLGLDMKIYHNMFSFHITLDNILNDTTNFLEKYNSTFLIFFIKYEYGNNIHIYFNLKTILNNYSKYIYNYSEQFGINNNTYNIGNIIGNLKLKDVRKKIIIICRSFNCGRNKKSDMLWRDNQITLYNISSNNTIYGYIIQDVYSTSLDEKIKKIIDSYNLKIKYNFLLISFFTTHHKFLYSKEYITYNLMYKFISIYDNITGIYMLDYPNKEMINTLININIKKTINKDILKNIIIIKYDYYLLVLFIIIFSIIYKTICIIYYKVI
jgi:hypothetical protein